MGTFKAVVQWRNHERECEEEIDEGEQLGMWEEGWADPWEYGGRRRDGVGSTSEAAAKWEGGRRCQKRGRHLSRN